jgi:hypothetical protein
MPRSAGATTLCQSTGSVNEPGKVLSAAAGAGLYCRIMSSPVGITEDQARAHVAVLDLLLAAPGLDVDTERRVRWLRMRLCELVADADRPFDFTDAKITWLLAQGAAALRVAA